MAKRGRKKKIKESAKQKEGESKNMTPQDLADEVAKQTTLVTSLTAYNDGWEKRLQDAIDANPGGVLTQADLDKVVGEMKANNDVIAAAMVANTPSGPSSPPRKP